jgi:hypothetical protein
MGIGSVLRERSEIGYKTIKARLEKVETVQITPSNPQVQLQLPLYSPK